LPYSSNHGYTVGKTNKHKIQATIHHVHVAMAPYDTIQSRVKNKQTY
jgi:hypothetical protein